MADNLNLDDIDLEYHEYLESDSEDDFEIWKLKKWVNRRINETIIYFILFIVAFLLGSKYL